MLPAIPQIGFCRSTLDVSLEAYPLCGAIQSSLRKRSLYDHGGLSHLGRSFNFSFISELATSYTEKSNFQDYFHGRKSTQKCPVFSTWKKTGHTVILYVIMVKYLHQEDAYEKSIINTRKAVGSQTRP